MSYLPSLKWVAAKIRENESRRRDINHITYLHSFSSIKIQASHVNGNGSCNQRTDILISERTLLRLLHSCFQVWFSETVGFSKSQGDYGHRRVMAIRLQLRLVTSLLPEVFEKHSKSQKHCKKWTNTVIID